MTQHDHDKTPHVAAEQTAPRLSDDSRRALDHGGAIEVLIEVTDIQAIQAGIDQLAVTEGGEVAARIFGDAFPGPYVLAALSSEQIEEVARLEGVVAIEENAEVTAETSTDEGDADD